ncbi:hypothetical protein [Acinetobacter baumannii]|uniref:hypothetical protein n=1 Tax=Acinetobacter baumannii TaxID=470 RepID=UPI0034E8437A
MVQILKVLFLSDYLKPSICSTVAVTKKTVQGIVTDPTRSQGVVYGFYATKLRVTRNAHTVGVLYNLVS